ncbi:MAG: serine hydrolase [Cytophagales bacterium]|nr:serine hydrolase [Cytophagales bacterium]
MKKIIGYTGLAIIIIATIFNIYCIFSGNYFIYKALIYNLVNIDDYKIFDNRTINRSIAESPWPISKKYNSFDFSDSLSGVLKKYEAVAFIVVKDDSILIEKYYNHTGEQISASFSMAKSVVSLLIGIALQEGKISSLDDPVAKYIPDFGTDDRKTITIRHVLMMSSGIAWDESAAYNNPIKVLGSDIMEAYYGSKLNELVLSKPMQSMPGKYFDYRSADTQILSMIIATATGTSLSKYFEEKIWQPIDAENDALWNLNEKNGYERAFCCLYANARDFARLGKLCLHKGYWNGAMLIDSNYINHAISPIMLPNLADDTKIVDYYGYQFWLIERLGHKIYYMRGTLGQFIIMIPKLNTVIVRLGKQQSDKIANHYGQTYTIIDEVIKMVR